MTRIIAALLCLGCCTACSSQNDSTSPPRNENPEAAANDSGAGAATDSSQQVERPVDPSAELKPLVELLVAREGREGATATRPFDAREVTGMIDWMREIRADLKTSDYLEWPSSVTDEMKSAEARLLVDEQLTGDLMYVPMKVDSTDVTVGFFANEPSRSMDEIQDTYGEPWSGGDPERQLTYGRIRIMGKDGMPVVVMFNQSIFDEVQSSETEGRGSGAAQ